MRRGFALPLLPLYSAAQAAHETAYRLRLLRPQTLGSPVISVGSLSAGGAGKTPAVLMLAALASQHHLAVDVLSRGYRRSGRSVEQVSLTHPDPATHFGDEPVEMARRGLRVFVGRDRIAAGRLAETHAPPGRRLLHLLDDGFQHRRLARQVDIVLVTQADMDDYLLPAGNLRESLTALRRADVVILRADEATHIDERRDATLADQVRRWTDAELWQIERTLRLPAGMPDRAFAFCGIARPESFTTMLAEAGVALAGMRSFPDHHRYTPADLNQLRIRAQRSGANGFLTTEKDAVKLTPILRELLTPVGPLATALLETRLEQAALRRFSRILDTLPHRT